MAIIIQRTNPDFDKAKGMYRCAACGDLHPSETLARNCAESNHAKRNAEREAARKEAVDE